jgi:DNA replication licensing factor MCM2
MAEAFAKMHLRDYVNQDDIDKAIRVMISSFIGAQKLSVKNQLEKVLDSFIFFFIISSLLKELLYRALIVTCLKVETRWNSCITF